MYAENASQRCVPSILFFIQLAQTTATLTTIPKNVLQFALDTLNIMEIHQHTNASKDVLQIQTISQTLFLKNVCLSANKAITPKIIPGAVYLNAFGTILIMLIMKLEDVLKNVQ